MKGLTKNEAEIIDTALMYAGIRIAEMAEPKDGEKPDPAARERAIQKVQRLYEVSQRVWSLVSEEKSKIGFVS